MTEIPCGASSVARAGHVQREATTTRRWWLVAAALLLLAACGGEGEPTAAPTATPAASATPTATRAGISPLPDGPVEPGRYRYPLEDWETCDPKLRCPVSSKPGPAPDIEVTVPAGWEGSNEFHLLTPTETGTDGPIGAALVLGWTSYGVALNADPCTPLGTEGGHQVPTIAVGPTVGDFVQAVVRHPRIAATTPRAVTVDGYRGTHFRLTAPSDLSRCENWRPWDPGFYAQGPDNVWDLWVVDVRRFRVVVVAHWFPETSAEVKAELQDMVASLRFKPRRVS
jgi:hypothetical protein